MSLQVKLDEKYTNEQSLIEQRNEVQRLNDIKNDLLVEANNNDIEKYLIDFSEDEIIDYIYSEIESDKQAILGVMTMQETAWSEGDLDAFMEGYWKSEYLVFVGKSGPQYGWQTTLDNYKKGYPDLSSMGKLQFEVLRLTQISGDAYSMIGKYTLIRAEDAPSGYFTLVWRKINGSWLIVSDHTSG